MVTQRDRLVNMCLNGLLGLFFLILKCVVFSIVLHLNQTNKDKARTLQHSTRAYDVTIRQKYKCNKLRKSEVLKAKLRSYYGWNKEDNGDACWFVFVTVIMAMKSRGL